MGYVYQAHDPIHNRIVAIKTLRQEILKMLDKDSSKRPSNVSEVKKKMILALEKQKIFYQLRGRDIQAVILNPTISLMS